MAQTPGQSGWQTPPSMIDAVELARALPSGLAHYASRGEWRTAPHLNLLTQKLVDLEQRRIKRLLVEMPPRHGKSELCSHYFPPWYLGRHPDHQIILASYASGFADIWGQKARDVLTEVGTEVFGVTVHPRRNSAGNWQVEDHQGQMRCAGTQTGGVTGRGANLLIIDDPIKDAAEAASEAYRDRCWDWYTATARSRLEPNAIVIIIMTRWNQDDLMGRIRKQMALGGEQWESITLPAVIDNEQDALVDPLHRQMGESLWPWRYTAEDLRAIKSTIPEHWWNALYQQRPTAPGGTLAKAIWFPVVDAVPPPQRMRYCRFWDCGSQSGDPTVGAKVGVDVETGMFYIVDIIRVFYTAGEADRLIQQTAAMDGPGCVIREEQEGGSAGLAVIQQRTARLAGYNYRGKTPTHAKEINWMPFLIQAEVGNFRMLKAPAVYDGQRMTSWNTTFLAEAAAAPHGEHDDQMDAVAGAFQELALQQPASVVEISLG